MRNIQFLIATVTVAAFSYSHAAVAVGAGHVPCAQVLRAGGEKIGSTTYDIKVTYLSWAQGYLSVKSRLFVNPLTE